MAPNVENLSSSTLLGSGWTLHSCHIARHGLNIHHGKIHHWSRSQLQSPVSSALSSPKWRRHFFWVFFFVLQCKQPHPEQSSRVLSPQMRLAGVEDVPSQRNRCEDSSCRRRHTDLSCSEWSRSVRRQTALCRSSSWTRPSAAAFPEEVLANALSSSRFSKVARTLKIRSRNPANAPQLQAAAPSSRSSVCFVSWKCFLISAATLKRLFTADRSTSAPSCFMDPEIVEFVSRVSVSVAAPCR